MAVVEVQRPRTDYAQLGALVGQAINPQQQLQAQLLPLLFKAQLERRQSRELLRELRGDGLGNYKFSFLPSGAIKSFEKKTEKEKLEDIKAQQEMAYKPPATPAYAGLPQEVVLALEKERLTREEKAKLPTATMRSELLGVKQQQANVAQMKALAEGIPGGYGGIGAIGVSAITRGKEFTETRLYLKQLPAFAAGLYRDLTGDKRLSDEDAARRAMPLLWHPSEDKKIKEKSFSNIERALGARERLLSQGRYIIDELGQAITPLDDVLQEAGVTTSTQGMETLSGIFDDLLE